MRESDFWSGAMGRQWAEHADDLDEQLEPAGNEGLSVLLAQPGEVVLDLGCGSGGVVAQLCAAVAPGGSVTGLDISGDQIAIARRRVASPLARFELGDAERFAFAPGSFDALFSRFGCMFFNEPAKAFGNVHAAMRPGARGVLVVWQEARLNPWASVPAEVAAELLGPGDPVVPGAPGVFSWASPSAIQPMLEGAGFSDVTWTARETTLKISEGTEGGAIERAVSMLFRVGPLARRIRGQPEAVRAEAARLLAPRLERFLDGEAVQMRGAIWVVQLRS
ncbi:MAG: methyltransferase domain-containing protein [Amaricoccus sp.]